MVFTVFYVCYVDITTQYYNLELSRDAGKDFFRFSKYYTDIYKPEIFILMETRSDPKKLHGVIKKLGFQYFLNVDNIGYSGGHFAGLQIL